MAATDPAAAAVTPKDAATVMLLRDAPDLEVFMLRRNFDSVWIAGATVFPGGGVDPGDRDPEWAARCAGWDDARASRAVGRGGGGLGFFVAAVRETFEEAGVLLARDADGTPVDASAAHLSAARAGLNDGTLEFGAFVADHDLVLATDELHVFSHWITPPGGPRRYDTWFFVAAAAEGEYTHDDDELIASTWVRPAEAVAAADRGEIDLIFPTRKNLEALARFATAAEVLGAASAADPAGTGRFVRESVEGRRIALPGDEGGGA